MSTKSGDRYLFWDSSIVGSKRFCVFVPDITIECEPPFIAGKVDSCWARVSGVDPYNKDQCEHAIGMRLRPIYRGEDGVS